MKKVLGVLVFVCSLFIGNAQYDTGIGVRVGGYNGLDIRHFFSDAQAVEVIFSTGHGGFILTGLYEVQKPFNVATLSTNNLDYYYGIGGHVAQFRNPNLGPFYSQSFSTFGIDMILGMEYQFSGIPFAASADIKPFWSVNSDYSSYNAFFNFGFGFRYLLGSTN